MKKLALIFLVLVSCSGTMIEFEESNMAPASTLLTISGAYTWCTMSANALLNWPNARDSWTADNYDLESTSVEDIGAKNTLTLYTVYRAGIVFDISALPSIATIDSVFIKLFNEGGAQTSWGVAIYRAPYLKALVNSTSDYRFCHGVGEPGQGVPFDILTNSTSLVAGTNTFKVNDLPENDWYGGSYVSYGVGNWDDDYLNNAPSLFENNTSTFAFNTTATKLLIYYTLSTPTVNSPKIYSIF